MTEVDAIISFVLGIISTLLVKLGMLDRYYKPKIAIGEDIPVGIRLADDDGRPIVFVAHRIVVRNDGRMAAKDCKAYITFGENLVQRTAWVLPDNNRPYRLLKNRVTA
jgi:hypothetical protein